ncbi:MAG: Guanine nucleotide-binding protein-like 3, partial [Paramarteilia canceri]
KASKRLTVAKKYKIAQKVRDHNAKVKKETKKKEIKTIKKKTLNFKVPKSVSFKDSLQNKIDIQKERRLKKNFFEPIDNLDNLEARKKLINDFNEKSNETPKVFYHHNREFKITGSINQNNDAKLSFEDKIDFLNEIITASDIVVEVLDARSPLFTANKVVEEILAKQQKKTQLVRLLNKSDLIKSQYLKSWLEYLNTFTPTIPFISIPHVTVNIYSCLIILFFKEPGNKKNIKNLQIVDKFALNSAELLMTFLNDSLKNFTEKEQITFCIIGRANVGKNSVVSTLNSVFTPREQVDNSFSKKLLKQTISNNMSMILNTGFIPESEETPEQKLMKNTVKPNNVKHPEKYAESIYKICGPESLRRIYHLPEFSTYEDFLVYYSKKLNLIKKGAILNTKAACKQILVDWESGKLPHFSTPPNVESAAHFLTEKVAEKCTHLVQSIENKKMAKQVFEVEVKL